jgi:hypothetical protein
MTLLFAWLVFPLLLAGLCLGCGLAVSRACRTPLQQPLVLPVGFATIVVIGLFATLSPSTARLTVPAVLAVAAVGLASSLPRRLPRVDGWAAGASIAVYAVFGAPVLASGEATFAGYIKLDDTSTFLALIDRALEHGRSLDGLAPSSYEAALAFNLPFYPLGSLLPVGIGATLTGEDPAWLFQPYLAFLAALLALVLYQLASLVVSSPPLRAAAAIVGAQAALLYGYALWGGVKELAAATLVALVATLTGPLFARRPRPLSFVPLAVAAAALVGVMSIGAAAWLVPVLVVAGAATMRRRRSRRPLVLGGLVVGLAVPSLVVARVMLGEGVLGSIRNANELGNLVAPLNPLQIVGIWLTGDFRFRPADIAPTYVFVAVAALAACGGLAFALARRAWEIGLFAASALGATFVFAVAGSPWVEAKAFAIASPAVLFAAVLGCVALVSRGRRVEGVLALAAVAGGVVWSNALAYREVNLAPRQQLVELEEIGETFAGSGPALMTEYQPYGVRHFLRRLDPEGSSELRRRLVPLKNGSALPKGHFADLASFRPAELLVYRTLVLRRSPVGSRPPAPYRLVWHGRFYEVWQRTEGAISGTPMRCKGRTLLYPLPAAGAVRIAVRRGGRYDVWVGGSFRGELATFVDGRPVGVARHQLSPAGQYVPLATVDLASGPHTLELRHRRRLLRPGSGGRSWPIGPLAVSPVDRCSASPA